MSLDSDMVGLPPELGSEIFKRDGMEAFATRKRSRGLICQVPSKSNISQVPVISILLEVIAVAQ